jgi:hypothetical protein
MAILEVISDLKMPPFLPSEGRKKAKTRSQQMPIKNHLAVIWVVICWSSDGGGFCVVIKVALNRGREERRVREIPSRHQSFCWSHY